MFLLGALICKISTHALREEGDTRERVREWVRLLFLPTPSARRATQPPTAPGISVEFLPTPSARRATWRRRQPRPGRPISTHALREEGDRTMQTRLL